MAQLTCSVRLEDEADYAAHAAGAVGAPLVSHHT
jgi:hypothetical protein